jgi:hypothetical protein
VLTTCFATYGCGAEWVGKDLGVIQFIVSCFLG